MEQSTELEYLRYIYNSLDIDTMIRLYKDFPKIPPQNYIMFLCGDCMEDVSEFSCHICEKNLCGDCYYYCGSSNKMSCFEHFQSCELCDMGCVCSKCRQYTADYTCSVCSDNYEIPIFCGCAESEKKCVICDKNMDPVTKERT
jgi:hypothetical protein